MAHTVLLVDDDADSRAICSTILTYHGFSVLEASDGRAGVAAALESLPDVILMDVNLPVLNGWAATRELKGTTATAGIPIVIFTARATTADRECGRGAGCDGYLTKPCPPREIVSEVRRVLGIAEMVGGG